jgi:hypothetical protein
MTYLSINDNAPCRTSVHPDGPWLDRVRKGNDALYFIPVNLSPWTPTPTLYSACLLPLSALPHYCTCCCAHRCSCRCARCCFYRCCSPGQLPRLHPARCCLASHSLPPSLHNLHATREESDGVGFRRAAPPSLPSYLPRARDLRANRREGWRWWLTAR